MFYDLSDVLMYMLQNKNFDCENKNLNRNAHNALKICFETLDYESRLKLSKPPLVYKLKSF